MARSTKEWIGKTDDSKAPPKVRQRIYDKAQGICHICKLEIKAGETWHADHIIALIEGGENRERNLAPAHSHCNLKKGQEETSRKSKTNAIRQKHLGIKGKKSPISAPVSKKKSDPGRNKRDPFQGLPKPRLFAAQDQ